MRIELATLIKLLMMMMVVMLTLSDAVSRGKIENLKIAPSIERQARQNGGDDVTKEGDIDNLILIRKYEGS